MGEMRKISLYYIILCNVKKAQFGKSHQGRGGGGEELRVNGMGSGTDVFGPPIPPPFKRESMD